MVEQLARANEEVDFQEKLLAKQTQPLEESLDKPPVSKAEESGYFTRDLRVLKNATYGKPDQSEMLLKQLKD